MWGALRHKSCCTQSANACEMTGREERRRPVCTQTRFCIAGGSTWQPRNVPAPDPNPDLGPRRQGLPKTLRPLGYELNLAGYPPVRRRPASREVPSASDSNQDLGSGRTQIQIWVRSGGHFSVSAARLGCEINSRAKLFIDKNDQPQRPPRRRTQIRIWVGGFDVLPGRHESRMRIRRAGMMETPATPRMEIRHAR